MPWRGPQYEGDFPSLGWGVLEWVEEFLIVPNGPAYGRPLKLTDEQARIVVRFYAVDESGRRVYRRASVRRAKGWGKSPLLAAIAAAELAGPVVFDGWDAAGDPVGVPQATPWVQIAAVSEDQTGNTYSHLYEMIRSSPKVDELSLDIGITRIFPTDRPGRLEPVTSSAGSREGQPVTFAVLDETHLWTRTNGGRRLAATIRRNVAKMGGSTFESTNAHVPGEESVAEDTLNAADKNQAGLLYDAVESPWIDDLSDVAKLKQGLVVAYGDAVTLPHVDLDRLVAEVQDPSTTPEDARRFYLNQLVKGSSRAVDPHEWEAACQPNGQWPSQRCLLAFDGSKTRDSTALVGWTIGATPHLFEVALWERPPGVEEWEVPLHDVKRTVARAMEELDVAVLAYDSSYHALESVYDEWKGAYGEDRVVEFPTATGKRMEPAIERFLEDLHGGLFTHQGDEATTRHVLNANLGKNRSGWKCLEKEKDSLKIDAAVAAVFGYDLIALARSLSAESELVPLVGGW